MSVYYNEWDPFAAAWLRELIKAGLIADGVVDERSITEVKPDELTEFTQCHFFAGIGGWSRALRLAGWPDTRPVWTGSPPCQPFSVAGLHQGKDDTRHLAPCWLELIKTGRPVSIFGEQVTAAVEKDNWLDNLQDVLAKENYSTGAIILPACCVGAPHIRQRLWFIAHRVADSINEGLQGRLPVRAHTQGETINGYIGCSSAASRTTSDACGVASTEPRGHRQENGLFMGSNGGLRGTHTSNTLNGSWRFADWLYCRDGQWRPVEPGTFPLANGVPAKMGRLRGYGNAIAPEVAAEVIGASMEIFEEVDYVHYSKC